MPSRFEIYKQSISKDKELETDIQELEKLYTSQKSFYNNYTFDDFLPGTRNLIVNQNTNKTLYDDTY